MDFFTTTIITLIVVIFSIFVLYLYFCLASLGNYVEDISKLLKRTFVEYYKGQDIEPIAIYNGIDLKWTGPVQGIRADNENGFITIRLHDNGAINSPLNELEEADILSEKIIATVYDYIKDKEDA